ncbi:hypothetical protein [Mesorhizobium sp. B2-8-9]|uniref:hypothetical protein n=1 Tax=Mesorhizobium sp. B2-8-9 TaxID=2589899 RepID=UPI001126FF14|nr:hypothetical protein [Mesorhizobium sp. B2-8-9]TPI86377.1 hypothetical protein FJ423_00710 [Mesorhizobium sp. B2-8-9]
MRNIFAYTAPGCDMPEFLSINEHNGQVQVMARSRGLSTTVSVQLEPEQVRALYAALKAEVFKDVLAETEG